MVGAEIPSFQVVSSVSSCDQGADRGVSLAGSVQSSTPLSGKRVAVGSILHQRSVPQEGISVGQNDTTHTLGYTHLKLKGPAPMAF